MSSTTRTSKSTEVAKTTTTKTNTVSRKANSMTKTNTTRNAATFKLNSSTTISTRTTEANTSITEPMANSEATASTNATVRITKDDTSKIIKFSTTISTTIRTAAQNASTISTKKITRANISNTTTATTTKYNTTIDTTKDIDTEIFTKFAAETNAPVNVSVESILLTPVKTTPLIVETTAENYFHDIVMHQNATLFPSSCVIHNEFTSSCATKASLPLPSTTDTTTDTRFTSNPIIMTTKLTSASKTDSSHQSNLSEFVRSSQSQVAQERNLTSPTTTTRETTTLLYAKKSTVPVSLMQSTETKTSLYFKKTLKTAQSLPFPKTPKTPEQPMEDIKPTPSSSLETTYLPYSVKKINATVPNYSEKNAISITSTHSSKPLLTGSTSNPTKPQQSVDIPQSEETSYFTALQYENVDKTTYKPITSKQLQKLRDTSTGMNLEKLLKTTVPSDLNNSITIKYQLRTEEQQTKASYSENVTPPYHTKERRSTTSSAYFVESTRGSFTSQRERSTQSAPTPYTQNALSTFTSLISTNHLTQNVGKTTDINSFRSEELSELTTLPPGEEKLVTLPPASTITPINTFWSLLFTVTTKMDEASKLRKTTRKATPPDTREASPSKTISTVDLTKNLDFKKTSTSIPPVTTTITVVEAGKHHPTAFRRTTITTATLPSYSLQNFMRTKTHSEEQKDFGISRTTSKHSYSAISNEEQFTMLAKTTKKSAISDAQEATAILENPPNYHATVKAEFPTNALRASDPVSTTKNATQGNIYYTADLYGTTNYDRTYNTIFDYAKNKNTASENLSSAITTGFLATQSQQAGESQIGSTEATVSSNYKIEFFQHSEQTLVSRQVLLSNSMLSKNPQETSIPNSKTITGLKKMAVESSSTSEANSTPTDQKLRN